jgi:hypothetical protein
LTKFRVTYKRLKPAGVIQFDPSLEFVDELDIQANTPEEAALSIQRTMPYWQVVKIERAADETHPLYGEARYGYSRYSSSVAASGARTLWPDNSLTSSNVALATDSLASFVSSYSLAQSRIESLRNYGIDDKILIPLQQNVETMRTETEKLRSELNEAVKKPNQEKLQELAAVSSDNESRAALAASIVEELVACNMLTNQKLGFESFSCSPETINALHTACKDADDFKLKIGALANLFSIDLKPLRALIRNAQDDWKSIKLLEEWAKQNSVAFEPTMFEVWRKIVDMRNSTFPYHATDQRFLSLVSYFGQSYPPKYPELWKGVLTKLVVTTAEFRNLLSTLG